MTPKAPNKLASIFIVGTLTLVVFWVHLPSVVRDLLHIAPKESGGTGLPLLPAVLGLLSIAGVAAFLGSVVQGISEGFIRSNFQKLSRNRTFCRILRRKYGLEELNFWVGEFEEAVKTSEYGVLRQREDGSEKLVCESPELRWPHPYSVLISPLFFKEASEAHLAWVLQHYATYFLVTDIIVVGYLSFGLSAVEVFSAISAQETRSVITWGVIVAAHFVAVYAMHIVALHRYHYAYNSAARHLCLLWSERRAQQRSKAINLAVSLVTAGQTGDSGSNQALERVDSYTKWIEQELSQFDVLPIKDADAPSAPGL